MFEDNQYAQKVKNQFGLGNVGSKKQLYSMLGYEEVQEEQQ